ncbi:caspase family protein [Streptomyces murinus]
MRYARRDATVLGALFGDNLDGNATLLLDGDATKEKFVAGMKGLAAASTDEDLVVVAFSGHGVRGGALAMYDTLPDRLAETSLSLDDFATLAREIPARALLLVLDCCFSGHATDKVLHVPPNDAISRNGSVSATRRLDELHRDGFVVIAASGRDQEAFEEPSFRHGVLSNYLIQGLLGKAADEDGRIHLLELALYVLKNVSSHSRRLGEKTQDPIILSQTSNIYLNSFSTGPLYKATADASRPCPVTAELSSLAAYQIPPSVVEVWQDRIERLNKLQVDAINEGGLLEGMNVLVSAPTSTGKTMVGELAALRAVTEGRKAVFLLPTRALVNEQYEEFRRRYVPLGLRVIRVTGELRYQQRDLLTSQFELAVLTYEKFIGLLPKRPDLLGAGALVIDEIQSLTLPDRGPLLETLLTWLRMREGSGGSPQIVGLSAVLGKPEELARWLRATLVTSTHRDVPLLEGVVGPDGIFRYQDQRGNESSEQVLEPDNTAELATDDRLVTRLVSKLVAEGQQVIVFRTTRGGARSLARGLARVLGLPAAETALEALSDGDDGRTTEQLRACLKGGVAFHIADLATEERRVVEQYFRGPESEVRVLVATTTLAQGVNLPADSVVIDGLEHPPPNNRPYSVSEYKNMAGRAGRTGQVNRGRAVILVRGSADADQKSRQYVQARPEDVRSALSEPRTDVRTVLLAALAEPAALADRRSGPDIERFLAATFAAHQSRMSGSTLPFSSAEVRRMVGELVTAGFLKGVPGAPGELPSALALTELGGLAVRSGLCVHSVGAVAQVLAAVPADQINRATLICAAQLTSELDDPRFRQLGDKPYREQSRLAAQLAERHVAESVLSKLLSAPYRSGIGIGHARRSLACLMWTEGVRLANIERAISHQSTKTRREAVGPIQAAVQRAADVITTVVEIACFVHATADLGDLPDTLPTQLELGIDTGLIPVAWRTEVPIRRSFYLSLARAGLTSPEAILAASPGLLLDCLGGDSERGRVMREAAAAAQDEATSDGLGDSRSLSDD